MADGGATIDGPAAIAAPQRSASRRIPRFQTAGRVSNAAFAFGFALAALVVGVAAVRVAAVGDPGVASAPATLTALTANLGLVAALGVGLGWRVVRLLRARGGARAAAAAPRLHLRFVGWFSLVAIAPAVVVAVLLGAVFVRGIDSWFSARTLEVVETSESIAASIVNSETSITRDELVAMALDVAAEAEHLADRPIEFTKFLVQQAEFRVFAGAYILDREGTVLVRAEARGAPAFAAPTEAAFATADDGAMWMRAEESIDMFRALFQLGAPQGAYLYVLRPVDAGLFANLRVASEATAAYRDAAANRGRLQVLFALLYLETALLVIIGAVSMGLAVANRIVEPIGDLVETAERIRDGDLGARAPLPASRDELALLGDAFNEMTQRLADQHAALLVARDDAEEDRRFTAAVLAGVTAGVIGVDARDAITIANASAADLLGTSDPNSLVGRAVRDAAPEFAALAAAARDAGPADAVVQGQVEVARDGRTLTLDVRAAASQDDSRAVVVTFADISRLVSAQRAAAWRDVARRIAHEIKNPLTPIQLAAERLRRKYADDVARDPDVFHRCLDTIGRQVADIGRMVNEFSTFARMPEPRMAPVDVGVLARDAVYERRVANPEITFSVTGDELGAIAVCDDRLIAQALANLLKNAAEAVGAAQARDPGARGGAGRVDVAVRIEDALAVIEVRDTGVGWPEGERERLMEPYVTTREKGTGLGLAIVRRVLEDHAGRLELDDRDDGRRGAVARLMLPLQQVDGARGEPEAASAGSVTDHAGAQAG